QVRLTPVCCFSPLRSFPFTSLPQMIIQRLGSALILTITAAVLGFSQTARGAPANDAFAAPAVVSGFPVTQYGTNVAATLEPGEPEPSDYSSDVGASVWYEWTAT